MSSGWAEMQVEVKIEESIALLRADGEESMSSIVKQYHPLQIACLWPEDTDVFLTCS